MNKTRRNFMLATTAAAVGLLGIATARQIISKKSAPISNPKLGINLSGVADWSSELPFIDLFKQSRAWFVEGKALANAGLVIDAAGWVNHLPTGIVASTIVMLLDSDHFASGEYVVLYEGDGKISIPLHTVKSYEAGRIVANIDGQKGAFRLDIIKTNPQNYIKNIRVIPTQYEASYQYNPWNPNFLSRWQGAASIRFMDLMTTNNSPQVTWNNRPTPIDASYALKGVPLEVMIDLANRLNTEPWFCLPHMADDDYIKQFALVVKNNLNPNLRAWVEYSNEVWNGGFEQSAYATKQGQRLKLDEKPWEAACKYTAYRSVQIFNIWQQVFGNNKRMVRVLAAQAAYAGVAKQMLSVEQAAIQADVLAIAPYIHFSIPPNAEDGITDKVVANWSLDKLFDHIHKVILPMAVQWIQSHKKVADQYGLKLVAYEAGQHLVGVAGAENNQQLTQLFLKANADTLMGELYTQYLNAWANNGGDLLCHYNSVGLWSKWGSWGLLQYYNDKPTPKFKAVINWANAHGQKMRL